MPFIYMIKYCIIQILIVILHPKSNAITIIKLKNVLK